MLFVGRKMAIELSDERENDDGVSKPQLVDIVAREPDPRKKIVMFSR